MLLLIFLNYLQAVLQNRRIIIYKTENGIETHTFSCKRSSSSWVSVHEYTADAFADVLNPADNRLRELLYTFQQAGGARGMGEEKQKKC